MSVINPLKPVQIEHDNAKRLLVLDTPLDAFLHLSTISQTGERILQS
jgi:hypothetical protein